MNDRLCLFPRAGEPSDVVSSAPSSSLDSFDSYNGDDARCFLQEWWPAKGRYSKATQENGFLESRLEASQATLLTAKEEANAAWAWLAESDAMVAGKRNSKKTFISIFIVFVLIDPLFL